MKAKAKAEWKPRSRKKQGVETEYEQNRHYDRRNQPFRNQAARNRARALKYNSNANFKKFEAENTLEPEFVCVCCHGNWFEKQVHVFTKRLQDQIDPKF